MINNYRTPDVTRLKTSSLIDILQMRASEQAEKLAYSFLSDSEMAEKTLSYANLDREVRAIAAALQAYQIKGERVLLLYPPGLEFIAAFFGCLYSSAIAVPVYPPDPARLNRSLPRLLAIIADAKPTVALTTGAILSMVEYLFAEDETFKAVRWLATDQIAAELAENWQRPEIDADTPAFLQYTSGSTGMPKGVILTHTNLLHNLKLIEQFFEHPPESNGVIWLPSYHDMGLIGGLLQPLYGGFPVTLMSPIAFLQRPFRWLQTISKTRATSSGGPNFAYSLCVRKVTAEEKASLDLSCWTLAFNGAETVRAETMESFYQAFKDCGFRREAFYPCYGLAEATLIVTGGKRLTGPQVRHFSKLSLERNEIMVAEASNDQAQTLVSSGRCASHQRLEIVDPVNHRALPPGQIGEVWVSGSSIAQGYWQKPLETAEIFNAHLADERDIPFLRTGDLGFCLDGELFITGRTKDMIIIRGANYYPQDIEWTVEKSHSALRSGCCAAFSIEENGEERLVVVVEMERRGKQDRRQLESTTVPQDTRLGADRRQLDTDLGVTAESHMENNFEEICATVRRAVIENHTLHIWAIVGLKAGTIFKTSSGKIQRHACRNAFLDQTLEIVDQHILAEDTSATGELSMPVASLFTSEPMVRQQWMERHLCEQVARILKISAHKISVNDPINSLGLDSLMAMEIRNQIEKDFGINLSLVSFLKDYDIARLAIHLCEQLRHMPAPGAVSTLTTSISESGNTFSDLIDTVDDEQLREKVAQLPNEELDKLLADVLNED